MPRGFPASGNRADPRPPIQMIDDETKRALQYRAKLDRQFHDKPPGRRIESLRAIVRAASSLIVEQYGSAELRAVSDLIAWENIGEGPDK